MSRRLSRPILSWEIHLFAAAYAGLTTSSLTGGVNLRRMFGGFDDVGFRTLHEGDDLIVFCLGDIELLQSGVGMVEKDRPIAFADAHSLSTNLVQGFSFKSLPMEGVLTVFD